MEERSGRTDAVILAAGEGSRMKSDLPKVLHTAAGRPLIVHVLAALEGLPVTRKAIVSSNRKDEIAAVVEASGFGADVDWAIQDPPRGTADAVMRGLGVLEGDPAHVLVLPGDAPLIETETIDALLHVHASSGATATVLTARMADPTGYGRVLRNEAGGLIRIVEEKDASYEERTVDEVNAGVYLFETAQLQRVLEKIDAENAQREFYLTDAIELLASEGEKVEAYRTHPHEIFGVNSRSQLARVAELMRRRASERWMDEGITIVDPRTTYIDASVTIGRDATIHPFTFLEGKTHVGARAEVGPQARIIDSRIDEDARVSWAVVNGSHVGPQATVGPFASLRPGTVMARGSKLGTFVETKSTTLGEDSKANHLAYLGDAEVGRGVNIGAGTITCNWDGENKHKTIIEDDAYIASDTMLVAPTHIGKRAATGAGAVVKGDVPDDALAVGVPARVLENKGNKMNRPSRPTD